MQAKTTMTLSTHQKMNKGKYFLACALLGLTLAGGPSRADETDEVSKLIQKSMFDQALSRADAYLASRPKDPQMRFLKGLILAERNRVNEAITLFTKLTEDYPELPEPYNNLAVLYAGKGDYEKARESLEMAIRTHPSYATAHENLGDVYAKMASQSYDKALQLDGRNQTAQTKLSLVRNLIGGKPLPETQAAAPVQSPPGSKKNTQDSKPKTTARTPEPDTFTTPVQPPVAMAPVAVPTASSPAITATPPAAKGGISAVAPTPAPVPTIAKEKNTIGADTQVLNAVERWAKAWSGQDIKTYLDSYSQEFDTPGNMSRRNWEKMREERIVGKETIRVVIENPLITITGNQAVVKFKQSYYSNRLNNISAKILNLKLEGGQWRIVSERVGG